MKNPEKLAELFQNEDFQEKVSAVETPEEFQKLLNENGLDYDLADVNEFGEKITKLAGIIDDENGELSEDNLETVSGGFGVVTLPLSWTLTLRIIKVFKRVFR